MEVSVLTPCRVCGRDTGRVVKGMHVHRACLVKKSIEVLTVEDSWGAPIENVLQRVISEHGVWSDRCSALGVSKVTLYSWVRKYLAMSPQQAVRRYHAGATGGVAPFELQTGYRDFLADHKIFLVPG